MEYRRLGASGLLASEVGLGTNNFGSRLDEARSRAVIDRALELGVTFIDTADVYGRGASETVIGKVLGARRNDVLIATKFAGAMSDSPLERGASRRWIVRAVEGSLRRLGTDYIDLYQVHTPDPATPILETLQAVDDLVGDGKVRYVGHSNFAAWQIADAAWTARSEHLVRPISAQHRYNLIRREIEHEVLPAARAFGLGIIPYVPLASGFLSGKYREGVVPPGARLADSPSAAEILTAANFARLERLETFARGRGHSLVELSIGWLLGHPEVGSVIAGASRPEQVAENVAAAAWRLDALEMTEVATL